MSMRVEGRAPMIACLGRWRQPDCRCIHHKVLRAEYDNWLADGACAAWFAEISRSLG